MNELYHLLQLNHILVSATIASVGTTAVLLLVVFVTITATVSHQLMLLPRPTSSHSSLFYCLYSHDLASSQFASICVSSYIETSKQYLYRYQNNLYRRYSTRLLLLSSTDQSLLLLLSSTMQLPYSSLKGWLISIHSEQMSIIISMQLSSFYFRGEDSLMTTTSIVI